MKKYQSNRAGKKILSHMGGLKYVFPIEALKAVYESLP